MTCLVKEDWTVDLHERRNENYQELVGDGYQRKK